MANDETFTFTWQNEFANSAVYDSIDDAFVRFRHRDHGTNAYSYLWLECDTSRQDAAIIAITDAYQECDDHLWFYYHSSFAGMLIPAQEVTVRLRRRNCDFSFQDGDT